MKIESHDRTVEQLLQGNYYRIPRFQRPYSWGPEQLEDLWEDVVVQSDLDYFIGSIVVYPGSEGVLEIVDGQQRLTTITVALAAVRDTLASLGEDDLASGAQNFIERTDKRNRFQYVLKTQTSYPYFQGAIQSFPPKTGVASVKPEERALEAAALFFADRLSRIRETFLGTSLDPAKEATEQLVDRLEGIRDKILQINVIHIEVDLEDDAYVIFERLNTRGLDLSLTDLLRNFLLRGLTTNNDELDLARDRFNSILEQFDKSAATIDPSVFVHHYWISRNEYVPRKEVFRRIKKSVRATEKETLLDDLVHNATLYRAIREPSSRSWTKEERDISRGLGALDIFNMALPIPFFLALLRAYDEKRIRLPLVKRAMRAVEAFHYIYTAVVGRSSSGGITKMYALHARNVLNANDSQAAAITIDELRGKLVDRLPSEDEFIAGFKTLAYSSDYTQQKRLVQYTLGRIVEHSPLGPALGGARHLTIEHRAPERGKSALDASAVGSIGNLLLIPEELNVRLGNQTLSRKKPLLEDADGVWLDETVTKASRWGVKQIEARATYLARLAYTEVWKV